MHRVLLSLWLGGAAVYAATTYYSTNAVIFGAKDASRIVEMSPKPAAKIPRPEPGKAPRHESSNAAQLQPKTHAAPPANRHAFSPNDPPSEVATAGPGQPGSVGQESATQAAMPPPEDSLPPEDSNAAEPTPNASAAQRQGEHLRVASAANIRNLPSNSADVIGTARAGAELRVKSRESGWVEFVDPDSGRSGWIDSVFLEPMTETADNTEPAAAPAAQDQPVAEEATGAPPPEDQPIKSVADGKTPAPSADEPPAHVAAQDSPSVKPPTRKPRAKQQAPAEQVAEEQASKQQAGKERDSRKQASKQQADAGQGSEEGKVQAVEERAGPPAPAEQEQPRGERKYVELPADEEAFPTKRRRFGLFGRRRSMMQDLPPEALPDEFLPPPHYRR